MIIVVPVLLLYLIFRNTGDTNQKHIDSFLNLCCAVVAWVIILYAEVEVLSLFKAVSFVPVMAFWLVLNIILLAVLLRVFHRHNNKSQLIKDSLFLFHKQDLRSPFTITVILISALVLILSVRIVPYNWDSMTYHLTRIMFWVQNKTVAHYATNDARQISSPMISEFVNLNLYILTKSDRLFNFIQTVSYLFNMAGVYVISKKIGLTPNWRKLSVTLYASAPIILAEALTTQVDNFATVWMVIFTYVCLILFEKSELTLDKKTIVYLIVLGACLGLGYLTKPSVCVAMVVFAVAMMIIRLKKHDSVIVVFASAFIAGIISLIVIAPEAARNIITYHALSDPVVGGQQLVGTYDPLMLTVNFVKNICYSLSIPFPEYFNQYLTSAVILFSQLLGVQINDPSISEHGNPYRAGVVQSFNHDTAINPVLMWLFLFALAVGIVSLIKRKKILNTYIVCSFLSFLIFLVILRWEMFETRYQISYLTLLCPAIVFVFSKVLKKRDSKIAFTSIVTFLCVLSFANVMIPNIYYAVSKASDRPFGYFNTYKVSFEPYSSLTNEINVKGYKNLGLNIKNGEYQYPLWQMCKSIEHVENVVLDEGSSVYENKEFVPDCIVWINDLPENDTFVYHDRTYNVSFGRDGYYLLTCSEK